MLVPVASGNGHGVAADARAGPGEPSGVDVAADIDELRKLARDDGVVGRGAARRAAEILAEAYQVTEPLVEHDNLRLGLARLGEDDLLDVFGHDGEVLLDDDDGGDLASDDLLDDEDVADAAVVVGAVERVEASQRLKTAETVEGEGARELLDGGRGHVEWRAIANNEGGDVEGRRLRVIATCNGLAKGQSEKGRVENRLREHLEIEKKFVGPGLWRKLSGKPVK